MKVKVVSEDSPKLLDRMRAEIRVRHYSIRTEEAYLDWARRFIASFYSITNNTRKIWVRSRCKRLPAVLTQTEARNFGFLHPNCKRLIALLQLVLKCVPLQVGAWVKARAPVLCPCCGAAMVIVKTGIRARFDGPMAVPRVAKGVC